MMVNFEHSILEYRMLMYTPTFAMANLYDDEYDSDYDYDRYARDEFLITDDVKKSKLYFLKIHVKSRSYNYYDRLKFAQLDILESDTKLITFQKWLCLDWCDVVDMQIVIDMNKGKLIECVNAEIGEEKSSLGDKYNVFDIDVNKKYDVLFTGVQCKTRTSCRTVDATSLEYAILTMGVKIDLTPLPRLLVESLKQTFGFLVEMPESLRSLKAYKDATIGINTIFSSLLLPVFLVDDVPRIFSN